jgi:hypothetical protein
MKNRSTYMALSIAIFLCSCTLPGTDQPLAAPSGAQATAGDGQVTLTWSQVAGADGYTVYRKAGTTVSLNSNEGASSTSGNTLVIAGLLNGTPYTFIVTAHNAAGMSGPSLAVTSTPLASSAAPAVPTNVQATAGDGLVMLTWNEVMGAASYQVYYKLGTTASAGDSAVSATAINGTTATVTGLAIGAQYAFVVTANNAAGTSDPSPPVTATPTGNSASLSLSGGILGDFTVTFTLSAGQTIGAPDTSGSYPVYSIPRSSLPLTVTASSSPTATAYVWLLDETTLSSTGASLQLTATTLSARKHNLTLKLTNGTDPNRSATIILDATN